MSPIETIKKLPIYIKAFVAVITFLITIGGVIFAAEDRYVTTDEVAQSLSLLNQKLSYDIKDVKLSLIHKELEYTNKTYYKIKDRLILHPDDPELLLEFNEIKEKRKQLKEELNK
ncbi:hypothetical protein GW796_09020 [archaeon]|nr:hypothetical protein [archaeon]NCT58873.1 hypothetical protein [archaeon]